MHRRLALITSTAGDVPTVVELAVAASAQNIVVETFFMDNATQALATCPDFQRSLLDAGCELTVCGESLTTHGIAPQHILGVVGSQDDHAAMLSRAHRVLAFT